MKKPDTIPLTLIGIQKFFPRTFRSSFVRNVAIVAGGTAASQAIGMAFAPIITRLYGPEAFGILGTFVAIAAVVTPIAALSYPIAIVLPKDDNEAKCLARLSAYIAFGMAAIVSLILLFAGEWVVNLLQVEKIRSFIWLLPLIIVFAAWLQINQQWLIRKKQFQVTARVAVIQAFLVNSIKAGIGLLKPLAAVLIVVYTFGSAMHAVMLSYGAQKVGKLEQKENERYSFKTLWKTSKKYYDFPVYRTSQGFIHSVTQSLPVLMLAAFFGPGSAGFYALSMKVMHVPTVLISKSIGDVFYPRINEAVHHRENVTRLILKATFSLAAIGVLPFLLIIAIGPVLFGFVFGDEWMVAGIYARWLAVLKFFDFINKPSFVAIPPLRLQSFLLCYEILATVLRIISLTAGFYIFQSDVWAIALFCVSGITMYVFLIGYVLLKSRQYR